MDILSIAAREPIRSIIGEGVALFQRPRPGDFEELASVEEAVRRLAENAGFAAIILCLESMDDGRDAALVQALRAAGPGIPLVILSPGHDLEGRAISLGARECVSMDALSPALLSQSLRYAIERDRLHSKLEQANGFLKDIVNNIPLPIFVKRAEDLTYTLINEAAERFFGYPCGDMIGQSDRDFFPLEQAEFFNSKDREVLEGKVEVDIPQEAVSTRHFGKRIVHTKKVPIVDEEGRSRFLLGISEDITERLQTEAELAEKAEQLRQSRRDLEQSASFLDSIVNNIPLPIFVKRAEDLTFVLFNEAAERFFGYPRGDMIGRGDRDFFPLEQAEFFNSKDREVLEGKVEVDIPQEAVSTRHLGERIVHTKKVPIVDEEGRSRFLLGISEDITERLQTEAELAEKAEQLRQSQRELQQNASFLDSIVNSIPLAVFAKRAEDLKYTLFNTAALDLIGCTTEEVIGHNDVDIFAPHEAEFFNSKDREVLESQVVLDIPQETVQTRNYGERILHTKKVPIVDEEGRSRFLLGISEDITERLQTEAELEEKAEQLRQSQKMEAVGQLAGGVAHDFNNMLSIMMGYAELILEAPEIDVLSGRKHVLEILKAAQRSEALTRRLLAFSRKGLLSPQVIRPETIVTEIADMVRRLIEEDIELHLRLESGDAKVKADPNALHQVLMNLAVNSRDAMVGGGRIVMGTRAVAVDASKAASLQVEPGDYVCIEVSDTGHGMSEETRRRVFEPFFTTKEVGKGTGLGLSMVYGIAKQSGGGVSVESAVGRGTTIAVYLPRHRNEAATTTKELVIAGGFGGSETILVVEDELSVRFLAREALMSCGYEVLEASDGHAALELLRERDKDIALVLTDVVMPAMSGPELAERIEKSYPGRPVVYMSGYADKAIMERGLGEEGARLVRKPFSLQTLRKAVREGIDAGGGGPRKRRPGPRGGRAGQGS